VIHTNTVEGYYSIFKHLHRYLSESDFRYTYRVRLGYSDAMRADKALGHPWQASHLPTTSRGLKPSSS